MKQPSKDQTGMPVHLEIEHGATLKVGLQKGDYGTMGCFPNWKFFPLFQTAKPSCSVVCRKLPRERKHRKQRQFLLSFDLNLLFLGVWMVFSWNKESFASSSRVHELSILH